MPEEDATGDSGERGASEQERRQERGIVVQLHPVAARVAELLEPHVERQGFELVSVEYHKGTRSAYAGRLCLRRFLRPSAATIGRTGQTKKWARSPRDSQTITTKR